MIFCFSIVDLAVKWYLVILPFNCCFSDMPMDFEKKVEAAYTFYTSSIVSSVMRSLLYENRYFHNIPPSKGHFMIKLKLAVVSSLEYQNHNPRPVQESLRYLCSVAQQVFITYHIS